MQFDKRSVALALAAALAALGVVAPARPAMATGMQGHIFMAQCAAEQAEDPRLRAIFDAQPIRLVNGAFFPDSGYTADDHDQGEIAHWEQYVEGYIQVIRERYKAPYTDADAAPHVAFLMGIAAHGITDSTFDALLYARADQVDPGDMDTFDMAMDIFLVHDMPRYLVPELAFDAPALSDVYSKIPHPVSVDSIEDAMSTARSGIGGVAEFLYVAADTYGERFPWARSQILDPRAPGGYTFGAKVVGRYYQEILRRLDGDVSADSVVIGSYPDADYPMVTLDHTRPDGKVILFFGRGIDRESLGDGTITVYDAANTVIPAKAEVFRGDQWANVLIVEPDADWKPSTSYRVVLSKSIVTLNKTSPSKDFELTFKTCEPKAGSTDCPAPAGSPPPLPCPKAVSDYLERPNNEDPGDETPPQADPNAADQAGDGCATGPAQGGSVGWPLLLLAALSALGARVARARRR